MHSAERISALRAAASMEWWLSEATDKVMRVALFATCLVDQLWPAAGVATVKVLRRAGCEVLFDPRQTCCGQPALNTGYRKDAARVAAHCVKVLEDSDADAIVVPSGSCASILKDLSRHFPEETWSAAARELGARTWELATFLVEVLGCEDLGARFPGRITWHDSCHGLRELGIHAAPRRLLARVRDAELVELASSTSCCGFGGTFSVKHPEISAAMCDAKFRELEAAQIDALVGGDVSCLLQISGRLERQGRRLATYHLSEILAMEGDR